MFLSLRKLYEAITVTLTLAMPLQAFENIAIIGGQAIVDTAPAYAALISSPSSVNPITFSGDLAEFGTIMSVSMSSNGSSLIGGQVQTGSNPAYAALISSTGEITPLIISGLPGLHGAIYSVAINATQQGIIGGRDTTGPIYAALVPPSGNPLLPLTFPNPIAAGGSLMQWQSTNLEIASLEDKVFTIFSPPFLPPSLLLAS